MNHSLNEALAGSRERELRAVVRHPDRLMMHALELERGAPPSRRVRRSHHATRSRRRS